MDLNDLLETIKEFGDGLCGIILLLNDFYDSDRECN